MEDVKIGDFLKVAWEPVPWNKVRLNVGDTTIALTAADAEVLAAALRAACAEARKAEGNR